MSDAKRLAFSYAKRQGVLIKSRETGIQVLHTAALSLTTLAELHRFIGEPFTLVSVDKTEFETLLGQTYESNSDAATQLVENMEDDLDLYRLAAAIPETEDLLESQDDAPIIKLINAILTQALRQNASDIHVETFENHLTVRFRVDGVLHKVLAPQRILAPLIVSRIKVMAKLDIAEKRLPQDGRISLRIAGRAVDIRVSTLPSHHGERVVLRLLDKKAGRLDLIQLGLSVNTLRILDNCIARPHGIILVTGPTGSGKTTTLYAALTALNDTKRNILTVEDPIEYDLPGIGQTQVNSKVDMTFARGLRAILRQDPDVVMVGEIRDLETAQIAVQASLTGHLVLSTLHTNTAIGAVTRLRDMGVEPFLIASSLVCVMAQRLVRLLCIHCKQAARATAAECQLLGLAVSDNATVYHPKGCEHCNEQGYLGRSGIYEVVPVDETLRKLIHDCAPEHALEAHVRQQFQTMRQDGCRRILAGDTTLEEVLRVTTED
jgi:general secretion pathway protein E